MHTQYILIVFGTLYSPSYFCLSSWKRSP